MISKQKFGNSIFDLSRFPRRRLRQQVKNMAIIPPALQSGNNIPAVMIARQGPNPEGLQPLEPMKPDTPGGNVQSACRKILFDTLSKFLKLRKSFENLLIEHERHP